MMMARRWREEAEADIGAGLLGGTGAVHSMDAMDAQATKAFRSSL
jgi:hypothetical protein